MSGKAERFDGDEREAIIAKYTRTGIISSYWNTRLPDCGVIGKKLRTYIHSKEYLDDIEEGRSFNVHGKGDRTKLLQTFARETTLLGDNVRIEFFNALYARMRRDETDYFDFLDKFDSLILLGVFDATTDKCPFPYEFKVDYEDFLENRLRRKLRTHFSGDCAMADNKWLSNDLRSAYSSKVSDLHV